MEEEEEVVIVYELVTVESSGEEAEGNMTEEEEDYMTEEEEDSMEEEEDGDEPEEDEDSMMEEEEDNMAGEAAVMVRPPGVGMDAPYPGEEDAGLGEEEEEDSMMEDSDYPMEEEDDEDMLEDAEVGPEGVGLDAAEEEDDIVWAEGVSLEGRILALRQRLQHAEDIVRQWENFFQHSEDIGAYIGCDRAAAISDHGGWPVVQAVLDGDAMRLMAAIMAVAMVVAAYAVAALMRALMAVLITRGLG